MSAQQRAVTEKGEEVILYDNGTWKSASIKPSYATRLDTLRKSKPIDASFLIKSTIVRAGIWINPEKWSFRKDPADEVSEYKFTLKKKDAYAMFIPERIGIPYTNLRELAIERAKSAAPDAAITQEEVRIVNGKLMHMLRMAGTISGMRLAYLGYYYSDDNATIQFVGFTSENLFKEYQASLEELLDGLDVSAPK